MKIAASILSIENSKANLIALPIKELSSKELITLDKKYASLIKAKTKFVNYKPKGHNNLEVSLSSAKENKLLKIFCFNSLEKLSAENFDQWRKLAGDVVHTARRNHIHTIAISLHSVSDKIIEFVTQAITEGAILGNYEFGKYKKNSLKKLNIEILIPSKLKKVTEQQIKLSSIHANATCDARDLVNTAPSHMEPKDLVAFAKTIKGNGISLKYFNKKALQKMKAFSLLAVARGSSTEPYLIHLSYKPKTKSKDKKIITLVGKGITFDSGGLSIKTGKGMEDMKCDMSGAAAVLCVMKAISQLPNEQKPKHEIHVLVPTCDNMINEHSLKPGDVISTISGKTIEVLNTDAEGRLILADAFCYAEKQKLKSDLIVDLATLTGACIVALGSDYSGLFSTNENYTKQIKTAFEKSGEKLWELPLAQEYRAQLNSPIADLKNVGDGGPGAITAALFLKEFIPTSTPWMHLDIAGPAFTTKSNEYIKKGGTGHGVLGLLRFIEGI